VTAYRPADTWSDVGPLVAPGVEEIRAAAQAMVSGEVADVLGEGNGVTVDALALEGAPADVLVQRATGAALLVVGTRGRGTMPGLLLGSVALRSVVHARCPVMVVRPHLTSSTDGALPLSSATAAI